MWFSVRKPLILVRISITVSNATETPMVLLPAALFRTVMGVSTTSRRWLRKVKAITSLKAIESGQSVW